MYDHRKLRTGRMLFLNKNKAFKSNRRLQCSSLTSAGERINVEKSGNMGDGGGAKVTKTLVSSSKSVV